MSVHMPTEILSKPHKSKRLATIAKRFPLDEPSERDKFYIDDGIYKSIAFHEELIIEDVETKAELGKVTISVKHVGKNSQYFQVRSSARATINGNQCGMKILSCVDRHFCTIEEKRKEYSTPAEGSSSNYPMNKWLYIGQDNNVYHCKVVQQHLAPGHVDEKSTEIPWQYTKNLVGEGANLLLLRFLAIKGYRGEFDLLGMQIDGHMCFANYHSGGAEKQKINRKYEQVVIVTRTTRTTHDVEERMVTTLARTGQELDHSWIGWPYMYRIHSSHVVAHTISNGIVDSTLPLNLRWEEDMELMSKYLDKKVRQRASHNSYLLDNPQLRQILSDYIQALLLQKPHEVIEFSVQFFTAFQHNPEYGETYGGSNANKESSTPNETEQRDDVITTPPISPPNRGNFSITLFCV